ncbi:Gamma-tubulin complex component 3 homolog OS=Xenopus laevis GN=tubgcp3 PE=1 SV=1 [Rhizoctonia solani AG-1 IB]|uniref:Gamma-tubulin complex component 3 homolog n=2 Tax=Thanatephorus cucumeris (strain AG1-IB / isolate 7/3/14) TaxID=1108050 RepID=A0A0B7FZY8_THACB|nr:Gamma-tubulin complex component 3 homolog OS=Xenopus laevis GN=tubgcp3 PE=1 SV=1 [Rhizoctonia solani AG-1 IB]
MPSLNSSLASLVQHIVPQSRGDEPLRVELVEACQEILRSHIGQSRETDIMHLGNLIKRQLQHSSHVSPATAVRFSNLFSRLQDQSILSRKHASLLFLHSLSSANPTSPGDSVPQLLPLLALPRPSSRTTNGTRSRADSISPTANLPPQTTFPGGTKPRTKAEILKEYRTKANRSYLPEDLLLRDVLYLLQGISGKYVRFDSSKSKDEQYVVFAEDATHSIPPPTRTLIHRLSELGYLFTRVSEFVQLKAGKPTVGLIEQSLCHHLQQQLTEYYRLLAVLEAQAQVAPHDPALDSTEDSGLTLRRLLVWTDEWRLRLRMMSVCVENCSDAHGGTLINLIHAYTDNGDPFVRNFTDQLLEEVSKPFFVSLHRWLFSGELHDPFNEFFVSSNPELAHHHYMNGANGLGEGALAGLSGDELDVALLSADAGQTSAFGGLRLWKSKYQFKKEKLPSFVGEAFGRKIFSTGKSLNFIRYNCHDNDWIETRNKLNGFGSVLKYSDITGLEHSIDTAFQIASQRLFDIFLVKFKLMDHLLALKQYLMLGHGDFADQLMETLGPNLSRPANTLYRHNLTATLDTAIERSNARFDSTDIIRRLDARMLEYSHGEIGWDVFTLEYKVDAPLDTVLDPESMRKYMTLFQHLWQMRRVDVTLTQGWARLASASKTIARVPELQSSWHQVRIVLAEMIHFIRQMQSFSHLEVIDVSWKRLVEFTRKKEGDLDALIEAHQTYLERIEKKVLLISSKSGREESVLNQVREAFQTILQFREATDAFHNHTLAEAARRDSERDGHRGVYTTVGNDDIGRYARENTESLPRILRRVEQYSRTFSDLAMSIVVALNTHSDYECRFLGVRLSFSDFYRLKRERQLAAANGDGR